ncbi:MAG: EamA family transporter [bacterium]
MAGNRINADRITVAKPERVGKDMLRIRSSNPNDSRMMRRLLAISFFGSGFVALNNKVLVELGLQDQRAQFLFIVYLTGLIIGLLIARPKDIKLAAKDWQVGIFMGITGIGAAYFLIQALLELQGIIVFPVRSSANLLLTALVSAVIWKERPGKKGLLGIILGAISIILINIK